MRVPLRDSQVQYASVREDVPAAIIRVCDTSQIIIGHVSSIAEVLA